jgi:DtxR family manganese transport transcriptional regulator
MVENEGLKMNRQKEGKARGLAQLTNAYVHSRQRNSKELAEDYVELIADLIDEKGEARAVDLAQALGVSHVTVSKTIRRLKEVGLVHSQPYRSIFLTTEGHNLATTSRDRHRIVREFLIALGVPKATAKIDAEGIEHHASKATIQAMRGYLSKG